MKRSIVKFNTDLISRKVKTGVRALAKSSHINDTTHIKRCTTHIKRLTVSCYWSQHVSCQLTSSMSDTRAAYKKIFLICYSFLKVSEHNEQSYSFNSYEKGSRQEPVLSRRIKCWSAYELALWCVDFTLHNQCTDQNQQRGNNTIGN